MKFSGKPVVIDATQWFKNGDHPCDQVDRMRPAIDECEGLIVRYYRHPAFSGRGICPHCGYTMHEHGWLDTSGNGQNVCPGDWIITSAKGEHYTCKPGIFNATYEKLTTETNK